MNFVKRNTIVVPKNAIMNKTTGESLKIDTFKLSENRERFSVKIGHTTFQRSFKDLNHPMIFLEQENPEKQTKEYVPVSTNIVTKDQFKRILETNTVKNVMVKPIVIRELGNKLMYRYDMELYSNEIVESTQIVKLIRDTYKLIQVFQKQIEEYKNKMRQIPWTKRFGSRGYEFKMYKNLVKNAKKQVLEIEQGLVKIDMSNAHVSEIRKGEILNLLKIVYPDRSYVQKVVMTTQEPLRVEVDKRLK